MPRYFVTTSDGSQAHDDDGLVLSNLDELSAVLRQTLAVMLHDKGRDGGCSEFNAQVHDETGHQVMTARVNMVTHRP